MGSKSTHSIDIYIKDPEIPQHDKHKINLEERIRSKQKKNVVHLTSCKPVLMGGKYQLNFQGLAKLPSNKNLMV